MKIGIDGRAAKWYRGTGIGTYSYELINSINKIDNENNYLIYSPKNCTLNMNFKNNMKNVYLKEGDYANFWDAVNIPNEILDPSLDLYHVPQNGIGLSYNKICPYVITLHDVIPSKLPNTVSAKFLNLFHEVMPKILPLCDGIITVSEYSKEDISKLFNFPKEKIFVTYLASEEIYKPMDKLLSKNIIKDNYGIIEDYILYVGGFSPRKNIIGILEAFNLLKRRHNTKLKLIIAGTKGISYELYKKRTDELQLENDVIFPGFISMDHICALYNAATLFVYPSFYEGFGLPPIEAMACGIPVVASNTTSIPEILKDSALLVNPNDVEDLYKNMFKAISDENLRKHLVKSGFKRVSELSWNNTANQTINAYKKIIKD